MGVLFTWGLLVRFLIPGLKALDQDHNTANHQQDQDERDNYGRKSWMRGHFPGHSERVIQAGVLHMACVLGLIPSRHPHGHPRLIGAISTGTCLHTLKL